VHGHRERCTKLRALLDDSGLSFRDFNYMCILAASDAQSSLSGVKHWSFTKTKKGFRVNYMARASDVYGATPTGSRVPLDDGIDAISMKLPDSSYIGPTARLFVETEVVTGCSTVATDGVLEVSYWFGSESRVLHFLIDVISLQ